MDGFAGIAGDGAGALPSCTGRGTENPGETLAHQQRLYQRTGIAWAQIDDDFRRARVVYELGTEANETASFKLARYYASTRTAHTNQNRFP